MGKATILEGGNPAIGYYRIRLDIDRANANTQILKTTRHIETLDVDIIPELSSARMDTRNAWERSKFVLDEIIKQRYSGGTENPEERLEAACNDEKLAFNVYTEAKAKYDAAIFKRESLRRKLIYLEGRLTNNEVYAWCADCTKHLQGEVGTIEIPGTTDTVLIYPGGADGVNSYYNASRDGQLVYVASMTTAEALYAFSMFPGWQKWRPTYRIGTILSIFGDGKYAFVELDEYYSDMQSLDINVESSYAKVMLRYKRQSRPGAINGAYRRGMRVVLAYPDQDYTQTPTVIGLEQNPCTTTSTTSSTITSSSSTSTFSTTTSTISTTTTTAAPAPPIWFDVKLTQHLRDIDGTEIDNRCKGLYPRTDFRVYPKNGGGGGYYSFHWDQCDMTYTYDPSTKIHRFTLPEGTERDPDGYWLIGRCSSECVSEGTQYPFKHGSERFNDIDLIQPYATYVMDIAWFKKTLGSEWVVGDNLAFRTHKRSEWVKVQSTVPYKVRHHVYFNYDAFMESTYQTDFITVYVPEFAPDTCCIYTPGQTALGSVLGWCDVRWELSGDFGGTPLTVLTGLPTTHIEEWISKSANPLETKYSLFHENTTPATHVYTKCRCAPAHPECDVCSPNDCTFLFSGRVALYEWMGEIETDAEPELP